MPVNIKIKKRLLDEVQRDIPAVERPFAVIGEKLGISEKEVLEVLKELKRSGVIRRIGGSFDTRKLGFSSTLAGIRVEPSRMAYVAGKISRLPGVTHCYERKNDINLWFTLADLGGARGIGKILRSFEKLPGVEKCYSFPVKRMFKIKTFFPA